MSQKEQILAGLEPLIQEAEQRNLWLRARAFGHDEFLFSPAELRAHHQKGEFIWGAVNWILEDPQLTFLSLVKEIEKAHVRLKIFKERLK